MDTSRKKRWLLLPSLINVIYLFIFSIAAELNQKISFPDETCDFPPRCVQDVMTSSVVPCRSSIAVLGSVCRSSCCVCSCGAPTDVRPLQRPAAWTLHLHLSRRSGDAAAGPPAGGAGTATAWWRGPWLWRGGGVPDRHVLQNFTLTKRDKQLLYICCVKNKNKKKNNFSYMCIMCRNKYSLKWQKLSFKDCRLNPHQESDRQTDRLINKPTKQIKAAFNNYYCVHTC